MSSNQPPTPEEPPPYGQQPGSMWGVPPPASSPQHTGPTEWLSSGGPPPGGRGGGRRRGTIIGASAAALALVVGGGAFAAYQVLGGGGPQPAEALPGSAIAYTRIDLDPSAEQKVEILRLLRRVPEFEEATGITSDKEDLRELIVTEFLESSGECENLSYEQDFAPWMGDRAGFALMIVDGVPQPVVSIQVEDRSEAEDSVQALSECSGLATSGQGTTGLDDAEAGTEVGIEFVDDYMLIAQTEELAADFAEEAETSPLSEAERFAEDMDQLGDEGVASFWFDVDALLELPELQESPEAQSMTAALEQIHSYAGAFRAGDDYLELAFSVDSDIEISDEDDNPVVNLPDSTLGAVSVSNGGDYVETGFEQLRTFADQMSGAPGAFDAEIAQFEAESGLMLPEDLVTVLGENVTASLDSSGLTPAVMSSPADIGFGVRFTTDPAAIQDVLDRVQAQLSASATPITLATRETDDGLVVATNDSYAETLAGEGELGDSDAFENAVPDAEDAEVAFYVDLDMAKQVAEDFGEDDTAVLEPMRAFGMSIQQGDDGYTQGFFRLTFD